MVDYAEEIFESIRTIAKKEIEALKFDTTIEATITDVSNAKYGAYVVTNGSVYFTAYSMSTDYKVKDVVLVTIPMGDYNQQKTIIGKKSNSENDVPIAYTSPFSQIIDVTNNLTSNNWNFPIKMTANGNKYKWENSNEDDFAKTNYSNNNLIWSAKPYAVLNALQSIAEKLGTEEPSEDEYYILTDYFIWDEDTTSHYFNNWFVFQGTEEELENLKAQCSFQEETGLTRIGLKADFQTKLKIYNTIFGNYGLVLCVGFRNPDQPKPENSVIDSTIIQPFVFDSKDFFVNIYNFETYYNQEAVFDISEYSNLILSDIFLFAYQKNNFKNSSGNFIEVAQEPNIFINNIYVCAGNERENFNTDSLKITSLSPSFYNEENKNKSISLRWIHKDEQTDTIKSLTQQDFDTMYSNEYKIRWYVDALSSPSPDKFTEQHWNKIDNNDNKFQLNYEISSQDIKDTQQKKIYVAVIKTDSNGQELYLVARSNILEFNNYNYVDKGLTVQDINALGVRFEDSEKGYYFMYNNMNQLENKEDTIIRELTAVFGDNLDNISSKSEITAYDRITWIFPSENSMIIPLNYQQSKITTSLFNNGIILSNGEREISYIDNEYNYKMTYNDDLKQYKIIHDFNSDFDESNSTYKNNYFYTIIPYQINKTLNFSNQRNTVYLELEKDGQTYVGQATMHFNTAGTSGSEYTMIINWNRQDVVFDISKTDEELSGEIILLNPKGQETSINNSGAEYIYNWYKYNGEDSNSPNLEIITDWDGLIDNPNNYKFKIKKRKEIVNGEEQEVNVDINELYILEVALTKFGNYDLITRIPIPLTQSIIDGQELFNIDQIEGPTQIRYSTDGTLFFDKTPYNISFQMKENDQWGAPVEDASDVGYWRIIPEDTLEAYLSINTSATFNNIIQFFINKNNLNINKSRLLYRLILNTVENINSNTFQLKDFDILLNSINEIKNNLNTADNTQLSQEFILLNENQDNFFNIIDKYTKSFNVQNNTNKVFSLLDLLEQISYYSKEIDYNENDVSTLTSLLTSENWANYKKNIQLIPSTFYASNTKLYGVQYIYNQNILVNGQNYANFVLWTQPIYIYQDTYPSPTLNKWNGELIIDNDKNAILAKSMSAGQKETDNTFSGVMFGDWTEDNGDTKFTGIYGFNHGKMTYAFKDNGSAFLGNDNGKISFNNNNSINLLVEENNNRVEIKPGALIIQTRETITDPYNSLLEINKTNGKNIYLLQSQNFSDNQQTGMKIDLQNGEIKGYNFSLLSQTNQNNMSYSLELSSGQNDLSFFKITRECTTSPIIKMPDNTTARTNSALLNEAVKDANKKIDKIYDAFILMISLFYKLANLDDSLYSQKIQEIYMKIIDFPNNELPTITELLNYIISQEELNNSKILNDSGVLKDDWQKNWTFDELSNAFLFLLNENQIKTIKEKFNFDININEDFIKNRNLFFPKIPNYKLNDSSYNNVLYKNEINEYNNLIYGTTNQKIENINKINSIAKTLIETYELDSLHYSLKEISDNNNKYYYINIEDGALLSLRDIRNGINQGPNPAGYYIIDYDVEQYDLAHTPPGTEILKQCYPKAKFVKIGTIDGKGDVYKLSTIVDASHKVFVRYANGISYTDDYRGTKDTSEYVELDIVTHDNTAVDLYFGKAAVISALKNDGDIDARYPVERQSSTTFSLGVKIKDSNELIGKQKIRAKIQETLNEYSTALNLCQSIIDNDNWISNEQEKKDKHIWNFYYNKIQSLINTIRNSSQNNTYLNQFPDILIPLDFSFRKELIITNNNLTDFHINDNGIIRTCNKNDFASINNNLYSLLDTKQYYVYLYNNNLNTNYIKSYLCIYETSNDYSQSNTTEQKYQQINYYTFTDLGITVLKKCEDIEQQEKFYQDSLSLSNNATYVEEKLWIFDQRNWDNDLININKNGGYITSKNYRPTMLENDKIVRKPTDSFKVSPGVYSQGLKGFVLDFTNDRFVLGNNASIQGYQSQYYPGQTSVSCREFTISTGANFITQDDRDKVSNTTYFIQAKMGWTPSQVRDIFTVDWTGKISCQGIQFQGKTVKLTGYTSRGVPAESGDTIAGYWLTVS